MTEAEVLALLERECRAAGGKMAWALKHGIKPSAVSNVTTKYRAPTFPILYALGLQRVVSYEPRPPAGRSVNLPLPKLDPGAKSPGSFSPEASRD